MTFHAPVLGLSREKVGVIRNAVIGVVAQVHRDALGIRRGGEYAVHNGPIEVDGPLARSFLPLPAVGMEHPQFTVGEHPQDQEPHLSSQMRRRAIAARPPPAPAIQL